MFSKINILFNYQPFNATVGFCVVVVGVVSDGPVNKRQ